MTQHRPADDHQSGSRPEAVGHDVKTILTTMRLQTQLLQRIVRQPAPDRQRLLTGLATIDAGISRLVDYVERERP